MLRKSQEAQIGASSVFVESVLFRFVYPPMTGNQSIWMTTNGIDHAYLLEITRGGPFWVLLLSLVRHGLCPMHVGFFHVWDVPLGKWSSFYARR